MSGEEQVDRCVDHLVIGAGFAGLCTAIKLDEAGESDYLVVERAHDVGGTWRDNTYPGAACDVPSQLYSFSFARNPEWSRSFSPQPEIQAYLQRVARDHEVLDRFRFATDVLGTHWDDERQRWVTRTSAGVVESRTLISGAGALVEPRLPDIDGIASFQGEVFHSSRWDHSADLRGKRVAVVGTGASAIQIVPEVAQAAGHLDVYQRTAPWVLPRHERAYTDLERGLFRRFPLLQKLYRAGIYWGRETWVAGFTVEPRLFEPVQRLARRHIAREVRDPELRAKVTPDFRMGCKRILQSNSWYPTLTRDDVELVTDPIVKVTGDAVVTADGTERPVDVLVVATGFQTTDPPIAHHVAGRDGRTLAETWAGSGMAAYKGVSVHGFPNYFSIVGPNSGLGHSSMVFVIESQVAYVVDALRTMRAEGWAEVEPRDDAQRSWNDALQRRMRRTVWNTGGCSSWYLDDHGRNTLLWPRTTVTMRRQLSRFDADAYATAPARTPGKVTA